MKILQVVKYYYPAMTFGGPVRCAYNLSKYLAQKGHSVSVVTTDALDINTNVRIKEQYEICKNIEIFRLPNISRAYGFFITPTIFTKLGKNLKDFDVVHLHEFRTFQNLSFYYTNRLKIPYVLTLHGQLFTEYIGDSLGTVMLRTAFDPIFGKRMLKGASKILALNHSEAKKCIKFGASPSKIAIVPNGIDIADFSNIPEKGKFRLKYGIKQKKLVLYVGRINRRKGIDVLIKACSKLFKKRKDAILMIVGADDGYLNEAKMLVNSLNLVSQIIFLGGLPRLDVLSAYNDADIVVCAGTQEGFPIVILEAGIMGKPMVVSDDSGADCVRTGRFGLTVKYGNTLQMIEALETLLNNPSLCIELGENGKRFVSQNFSWENVGEKIEKLYCSIKN